tara:strand:- start:248 stop:508 length:261 start_codon:yes stop_codon:yes gene_type:complete
MSTRDKIERKCDELKSLLLSKNDAYGNAALEPIGIFSQLESGESIKVRIDDKLSRIQNRGVNDNTEDTVMDLAGYLILLMISLGDE